MSVCKRASTFAMVKYSIRDLIIGNLYTKNAFVTSDYNVLYNKAQFFAFYEVCLNPYLFTSLRTVYTTKTRWLPCTFVPSLFQE